MSQNRAELLKDVFYHALQVPPDQRPALLDQSGLEAAERAQVETLLSAHSGDYLTDPAFEEPPLEGARFGQYKIISQIARGGMGTVYRASRVDALINRNVALKILTCGVTPDLVERFRREIYILAELSHPNIVSIIDVGATARGELYFVMEYVDGPNLDEYLRKNALPLDARLKLFCTICEAVAYAHRNLVIHRDLKPSNILVNPEGGPMLADFGLAKLMRQTEDQTTGELPRMTLRYASPEQVQGYNLTTATDIYSLGVILCELVTGAGPYSGETEPASLMRIILNEEPNLKAIADPDLQSIVALCLRKKPGERYETVEALKQDIHNFLDHNPINARKGGQLYRLNKYSQRHATLLTTGALLFVVIAIAFSITLNYYYRAVATRAQLTRAISSLDTALSHLDDRDRGILVQSVRNSSAAIIEHAKANNLTKQERLLLATHLQKLGVVLGHPSARFNLGATTAALEVFAAAKQISSDLYADASSDVEVVISHSRNLCSLGSLHLEVGQFAEAHKLFTEAVSATSFGASRWASYPGVLAGYADSLANLSRSYFFAESADECLRLRRKAVAIRRRVLKMGGYDAAQQELASGLSNLCSGLVHFGQYDEAITVCQESQSLLEHAHHPNTRDLRSLHARNSRHLATTYLGLHNHETALDHASQSVAKLTTLMQEVPVDAFNRRELASALTIKALAHKALNNREEALTAATAAARLLETAKTEDPDNVLVRREHARIQSELTRLKQ